MWSWMYILSAKMANIPPSARNPAIPAPGAHNAIERNARLINGKCPLAELARTSISHGIFDPDNGINRLMAGAIFARELLTHEIPAGFAERGIDACNPTIAGVAGNANNSLVCHGVTPFLLP